MMWLRWGNLDLTRGDETAFKQSKPVQVYVDLDATRKRREPDFIWPYKCHEHGHIYSGDSEHCRQCGFPWAADNPITKLSFQALAGSRYAQIRLLSHCARMAEEGIGV